MEELENNVVNVLGQYGDNQRLKLGSASGFWYVGTVGDFLDRIENINDSANYHTYSQLQFAERNYSALQRKWIDYQKQVLSEIMKDDHKITVDSYVETAAKLFKAIDAARNRVKTWRKRRLCFEHVANRAVKECEFSDPAADLGVLRCVITGYEVGAYWTTDEAKTIPSIKFGTISKED